VSQPLGNTQEGNYAQVDTRAHTLTRAHSKQLLGECTIQGTTEHVA